MKDVIFASMGNDSIALIQWCINKGLTDVTVAYSNTGWAAPFWQERVERAAEYVMQNGYDFVEIQSEGMEALVRRKKGFPAGGRMAQFCTTYLKIEPALDWLESIDPDKNVSCITGVRREESRERSTAPEHIIYSERHGGRELWQPLVRVLEPERNALIEQAGFEVLPHRSAECFPCINANIDDLRALDESSIKRLEKLELDMGFTKNNKPRVMFRPARHKGAVGIRQVVKWAKVMRIDRDQIDFVEQSCTSGWCGD